MNTRTDKIYCLSKRTYRRENKMNQFVFSNACIYPASEQVEEFLRCEMVATNAMLDIR